MRRWGPTLLVVCWTVLLVIVGLDPFGGNGAGDAVGYDASSYRFDGDYIPGLSKDAILQSAAAAIPDSELSSSKRDRSPEVDDYVAHYGDDGGPDGYTQRVTTVSFVDDSTVSLLSCSEELPNGFTTTATFEVCLNAVYDGADQRQIRPWMESFFADAAVGASIRQDRAGASWMLTVEKYGDVRMYEITIQPAVSRMG